MRKNRLLSLLLTAAMLATTAAFTACSSDDDDDAPEKDPNVIIAGENDPLGKPIGLVYTDFLTPNDVTHNADTTELSISKALADKKGITNFVNRPMGIWDDQQHRAYLRRATEQRLVGDRYVLKVVRSSIAEVTAGQEMQLNTHLYYNPARLVTRGGLTRASQGDPEADKYVDDNNVIHPVAITLRTKPNNGANSEDLDLSQAGSRTITIEDMFSGKTDGANSWLSDLWDDVVDAFEDAWDAIVDATSYDWDPHNNWSLLKSKTMISSDVKFNCGKESGDTITLRLRCPIEFNLDYTLNIDSHGSIETAFVPVLDYLETYVEGYLDVNPQARIGFSKTITLPEDKQRIRLFQFSGVGFTFMLGPVPLAVDIDPSVYLKFTSTLKGNAYLGVQYDIATKFKAGFRYSNGSLSGIAEGEKVKDEFSFINPKAELELKAGVGLFFGCDIVIEKIGGPTFNVGPQVNINGKLSYQIGDDRINASIEGKAGVGGEIGAVLKVFGYQIADWRTYFDIGPQWTIFKYPDDGSGSSGNYDPNNGGGGNSPYPFDAELEEKYKDYNYIPLAGSPVTWKSCGYENLFNGKTWGDSWEPFNDDSDKVNGVWYAEFKSKRPITPIKYYMTTSFNASYYPEWNPKSWKVYAKANASDSWTTIATVTNDNRLSGDEQRFEYPLSVTGRQWQYFRLEVSENHGGSLMQFAEFEFDEK